MRRWLRSLRGRLLAIAILSTLAALLFAGLAIGHVLERFVLRGLDERLDAQVLVLARAVRADGTLDPVRAISLPSFDVAGSGWTWRVDTPGGRRWESQPGSAFTPLPPPPEPREHRRRERIRPGEADGPGGTRLHIRQATVASAAGPVTITAAGPWAVVAWPLREAMAPLLAALAILGAGLGFATLVQLRVGLRPLTRLAAALALVRSGRARHVPADQPEELSGIVAELNALIDQNAAGLEAARRHVSNLAHGMKTPLAALALKLDEPDRDPDGSLKAMVAQIDRRVRHHLGRARAATPAGRGRLRTPLGAAVDDLVAVLARLHAERAIGVTVDVPVGLVVAVDAQDLDEMLGNLLDNGHRHARTALAVAATAANGVATILVEDDGAGLADDAISEALMPGRRLDEAGEGYGFGLSIVAELAELNGGGLALARSARPGWGLAARLRLPLAEAG